MRPSSNVQRIGKNQLLQKNNHFNLRYHYNKTKWRHTNAQRSKQNPTFSHSMAFIIKTNVFSAQEQ